MNSKYFEVRFDPSDEPFAQTLMARADVVYAELMEKFGFTRSGAGQKILLTVCKSVPEYLEATHKAAEEYQEWMVGSSNLQNQTIAILSPRISTTHTAKELEKVFVHETVHMILDTQAGHEDAPIWCAEGIAVLYAEQVELDYIDEIDYPKIKELLNEETFAERGGYNYSGVYIWYFIERYGFSKFWELYNNVPGTFEMVYDCFEEDAIRSIKKIIV